MFKTLLIYGVANETFTHTQTLATTSVVCLRSWKAAVDAVLGALVPVQLCEELCAYTHVYTYVHGCGGFVCQVRLVLQAR